MKRLISFILFNWLRMLSWLPLSVLYALGTPIYILVYHVLGYRRDTVNMSLGISFPDKTAKELAFIEKSFYKHFVQIIMESIKSFSISKDEIHDRVLVDPQLLSLAEDYYQQNKQILIVIGHYGNWEWAALRLGNATSCQSFAIYNALKNPFFDRWIKRNRERFGTLLIPSKNIPEYLEQITKQPSITAFVGDQSPVHVEHSYWTDFMGRDTPVFRGFEKYCKQLDATVWYCEMEKLKKGYYRLNFKHITDHPHLMKTDEITEIHTKLLEQTIKRRPEYWLWTHRRWKRAHLKTITSA